jgi:hypothetical protein
MSKIRGSLPESFEGYPAVGAYHEIIASRSLDKFMQGFCAIADEVFQRYAGSVEVDNAPHIESTFEPLEIVPPEDDKPEYDFRRYYRAYYASSMFVSVLDMSHSERIARAMRSVWEKQDLGATEKEARNAIGRLGPDFNPSLHMDQVIRLGRRFPNASAQGKGRKLALVPNASRCVETQDFLQLEHEIVIEAIRRRLKQFVPDGEYVPHLTFAWFTDRVTEEQVEEISERTTELTKKEPLQVNLARDITFRERLIRRL